MRAYHIRLDPPHGYVSTRDDFATDMNVVGHDEVLPNLPPRPTRPSGTPTGTGAPASPPSAVVATACRRSGPTARSPSATDPDEEHAMNETITIDLYSHDGEDAYREGRWTLQRYDDGGWVMEQPPEGYNPASVHTYRSADHQVSLFLWSSPGGRIARLYEGDDRPMLCDVGAFKGDRLELLVP
jgi:hypothetical protein